MFGLVAGRFYLLVFLSLSRFPKSFDKCSVFVIMKGSKSPDSTEVTPSKKKLKQARLPFMVLSDVSPKTIQPRKRKLSDPQDETVSKIGKISNENIKDSIVISDEECQEITESPKDEKVVNPFVKLVNTAYKKKVLKSKKKKAAKKNATSKETQEDMPSSENEGITNKVSSDIEAMEVDECVVENGDVTTKDKNDESTNIINNNIPPKNKNNTEDAVPSTQKNTEDAVPSTQKNTEDSNIQNNTSIIIEDSNDTTDQSPTKEITNIENKIEGSESIESAKKPQKKTQVKSSSPKVTPQRSSLRNRSKIEKRDKLNDSSSSSKLEEPINSTPTTPKTPRQNKSIVNGQDADVSLNNSTNTTPKQAQKRLESAKKKEEREKEKLERELKKQQEKEERARQKLEKDEQRKKEKEEKEAAKKKEREDKEELKRKEKEEKEKQRELEKKLREEKEELKKKEKEEKEEQRKKEKEAREEEKRKKQEALELEKQEQELKKKKAAEAFVNFFVPKQKTDKEQTTIESSKNSMLSTFAVKSDMRLAPTTRNEIGENEKKILEDFILKQNVPKENLYINSLKSGSNKPLSSTKTWPIGDKDDDDDVVIVEDELPPMSVSGEMITCEPAIREKLRPKLLSFHQNRRPPYWGTWRKKSSNIKPRKPFGQDEKLDYEIDSDDDWEEEQEGESLDGSVAGSDDEQDNDEYEVDNEVFVPHGYLSDEEATMDEDDVLSLTPEAQKQKLKHLEEEFEFEHKKPTEKLKPRLYGLLWETNEGGKPENCVDALYNYFGKLSMIMDDPTPFLKPIKVPDDVEKKKLKKKKAKTESKEGEQPSPKAEKKKKTAEAKESKKERPRKVEPKKVDVQKKNQPGINSFLTKIKPT